MLQLVVKDFLQFGQAGLLFYSFLQLPMSELYEFDCEKIILTLWAIINAYYLQGEAGMLNSVIDM